MKNFVIAFCVFLVWSFFGLWLYYWLQEDNTHLQSSNIQLTNNQNISDTLALPNLSEIDGNNAKTNDTLNPIADLMTGNSLRALTTDGDILFNYEEAFVITKNSPLVFIPQEAKDFKYKLNNYFVEHPNTELHIISKYSAEENTVSPNMGVQRAKQLKDILVEIGIPSTHLVIKPHITPIAFNANETYNNAFSFLFEPLNQARLAAIKNEIPDTKVIYPRFSTSGILNSHELEKLLEEVKLALDNNPNVSVEVIGHTDNVGNAQDNYHRGLEFSRQVRWYLVAKGRISRHRIKASSKGESEAIASNNTEKGRNLNQRIEIRFIE